MADEIKSAPSDFATRRRSRISHRRRSALARPTDATSDASGCVSGADQYAACWEKYTGPIQYAKMPS